MEAGELFRRHGGRLYRHLPLSENCAEGTQEAIDAAKEKIINGTFKVFEGEIKDNEGNIVNKAGEVISDADITGNMNWYFENVEVK